MNPKFANHWKVSSSKYTPGFENLMAIVLKPRAFRKEVMPRHRNPKDL